MLMLMLTLEHRNGRNVNSVNLASFKKNSITSMKSHFHLKITKGSIIDLAVMLMIFVLSSPSFVLKRLSLIHCVCLSLLDRFNEIQRGAP